MDIFDNCRICLREINHEPIKMTRLILRFLQKSLLLTNVIQPSPRENAKQNLCAPCFNRISEFQDFLEQCKDSDEFWKEQFDDLKKSTQNPITFEETVFNPLKEDSSSLEADTTTEIKLAKHLQSKEGIDENDFNPPETDFEEKEILNENEITRIDDLNWQHEENEVMSEYQKDFSECDENTGNEDEEFIEYEYKIDDHDEIEAEDEEFLNLESENTDTGVIEYDSFAYAKIEAEKSSEDSNIIETIDETLEENSQTTQNSFLLTTSIDEKGKVKMSYKCSKCDKSFSRIYDIESHYNIHNGIKPFTCDVCGKSFRQKNILTTHQALHFGKKVECAECGKKFARRSQLILHYRMHRDEKPFVCSVDGCQAAFRQRKQLADHCFIHSGERNFQCATCTKSFHTRKRLQDHIYKVHSQHRYRCELCVKGFLKPHMLKHHMITVHNVEVDDVSHLKTIVNVIKPIKKKL